MSMNIPREMALKLCDEIRSENSRKWFSIWKSMCFFCYKFANGDMEKLCISNERGCSQVNKRYKCYKEHT